MNRAPVLLPLDIRLRDTSFDPDDVVVPGAPVSCFSFCDRIKQAMDNARIETVDQFLERVMASCASEREHFRSGVGDLGPNATAVVLLTALLWGDAEYEAVEPILDETGCLVEQGGTLTLRLSQEMADEWQRQVARFREDPLFALVRQPA